MTTNVRDFVQASAIRAPLLLVLVLCLAACGRAPESAPTATMLVGETAVEHSAKPPATPESEQGDSDALQSASTEPTAAAPAEASPAAGKTPPQPAPATATPAMSAAPEPTSNAVEWGERAPLPEANSEITVAELDGLIYVN